ncbi:unnamed protein product [Chrysoparadoxa australica]
MGHKVMSSKRCYYAVTAPSNPAKSNGPSSKSNGPFSVPSLLELTTIALTENIERYQSLDLLPVKTFAACLAHAPRRIPPGRVLSWENNCPSLIDSLTDESYWRNEVASHLLRRYCPAPFSCQVETVCEARALLLDALKDRGDAAAAKATVSQLGKVPVSVKLLEATKIAKVVSKLRGHRDRDLGEASRQLFEKWKSAFAGEMTDEQKLIEGGSECATWREAYIYLQRMQEQKKQALSERSKKRRKDHEQRAPRVQLVQMKKKGGHCDAANAARMTSPPKARPRESSQQMSKIKALKAEAAVAKGMSVSSEALDRGRKRKLQLLREQKQKLSKKKQQQQSHSKGKRCKLTG